MTTTVTSRGGPSAGWAPIYLRDVDLILGDTAAANNFKCQLRSVLLEPDANITRIKTLCTAYGQYASVDDPEWTLTLGYLYGAATADAGQADLTDYLFDNYGEQVPFTFRPASGGRGYTGTVTLVPGAIGGEHGNFSEQSVSLPVEGQPTRVPPEGGGAAPLASATPSASSTGSPPPAETGSEPKPPPPTGPPSPPTTSSPSTGETETSTPATTSTPPEGSSPTDTPPPPPA